MKRIVLAAAVALLAFSLPAAANEAKVKKAFEARFPGQTATVTKMPFLGLYEILVEDKLLYVDEKVSYIFAGEILDAKTMENLTQASMAKLNAARLKDLPYNLALKTVKGDGKRTLIMFSDPNCPYCKKIEKEMVSLTNVTIYTFIYPILSGSEQRSRTIWCSADRLKAWDDWMQRGVEPAAKGDCDAPIGKLRDLGQALGVNGTPAIFFANGRMVPGAVPVAQLEKYLNEAAK
jgi:thiol:disulfide interchange protein DsbC